LIFSFCSLNFAQFAIRNKKKKLEKIFFSGEKFSSKTSIFFLANFLPPFSLKADNFRRIINHILIGLEVPNTALKNQGGLLEDFFELFSPRRTSFGFSKNSCAKSITNRICLLRHCSTAPPSPGRGQANGQTSAGRSSYFLMDFLVNS
jgi:hypothetical protein